MIKIERKAGSDIETAMRKLAKQHILVGIRSTDPDNARTDGKQPITNAQLGFIHEFGSPARNIPARPFLKPGVKSQQKMIGRKLVAAAKAAAAGDAAAVDTIYEGLALEVPARVKEYMTAGIPPPLAKATLKNRHRSRLTQSMRDSEIEEINRRFRGGLPSEQFANVPTDRLNVPLINTGELRDSIKAYIVKEGE